MPPNLPLLRSVSMNVRSQLSTIRLSELALFACLVFGILLGIGTLTFEPLDDWLYDHFVQSTVSVAPMGEDHQVMLVYVDRESSEAAKSRLVRVVNTLHSLGATCVGVATDSREAAPATNLGKAIHPPKHLEGLSSLESTKTVVPSDLISTRLIHPSRGIYRQHWNSGENSRVVTLESAMAKVVAGDLRQPDTNFRVRFRGGPNSLPSVSGAEVLNESLVRELVSGKSVLIGWAQESSAPLLATPTSGRQGMTSLEFRGHALATLLSGDAITSLSLWMKVALSMAFALAGYVLARAFTIRWTTMIAVVALIVFGGAAWILLRWHHLWIPCVPLAVSFLSAVLLGNLARRNAMDTDLRRSRTSQLGSDLALATQANCDWSDIATLINQFIDVERMALMDLAQGAAHLRIAHLHQCGAAQVSEKRRDITRSPYSDASEKHDTAKPPKRPFFEPKPNETQYLEPLLHGGEVVGFIAVGIAACRLEADPSQAKRLRQLAPEIASLVALKQSQHDPISVPRSFAPFKTTSIASQPGVDAAIAVYDLFGNLRMMNSGMMELLQQPPFNPSSSLSQVLSILLAGNREDARHCLTSVILNSVPSTTIIRLRGVGSKKVLQISPIHNPAIAFDVEAVCITLMDASTSGNPLHDTDGQVERLIQPVLKNAARVWGEAEKLADAATESCPAAPEIGSTGDPAGFDESSTRTGLLTSEISELLSADAMSLLGDAVLKHADALRDRQFSFELEEPNSESGTVSVDPELLASIFDSLIELFVSESPQGSTLTIECDYTPTLLSIRVSDSAKGSKLDEKATDDTNAVRLAESDAVKRLRQHNDDLVDSGCRLNILVDEQGIAVAMIFPRQLDGSVQQLSPPTASAEGNFDDRVQPADASS